jgi:hypothetical protein
MDADTPHAPTDPVALLATITTEDIRVRLDQLDAEQRALRVLLRSAIARERARDRRKGAPHG